MRDGNKVYGDMPIYREESVNLSKFFTNGAYKTWSHAIESRNCHYIASPIMCEGKGLTIGWYKVLGFLYL